MAWIMGLMTDDEITLLRSRGWQDEDPPHELTEDDVADAAPYKMRAVFVNNDVIPLLLGTTQEEMTP